MNIIKIIKIIIEIFYYSLICINIYMISLAMYHFVMYFKH